MSADNMYLGQFARLGANTDITSLTGLTGQVSWAGALAAGLLATSAGVVKVTNAGAGYGALDVGDVRLAGNGTIFPTLGMFGRTAPFDFGIPSASQYKISSGTDGAAGLDTGYGRHAAGVGKLTNGTTGIRALFGGGTNVASAATLPLPTGRQFHVTGTTGFNAITSTNFGAGAIITIIFDANVTITGSATVIIAGGTFAATANDTITLGFDGTAWYEHCRSVN